MRLSLDHIPHILSFLLFIPSTTSHGYLSSPPARHPGPATLSACGEQVYAALLRDNTSHVEGLPELLPPAVSSPNTSISPTTCNPYLCRGIQYPDTPASNTQVWRPGQLIPIKIKITIPHDGYANVSIVDIRRNEVVGDMLVVWGEGYANEKDFFRGTLPLNQTEFSVRVPGLGGRCRVRGECVLQWWWYAKGARQTYESCVDFIVVDGEEGDGR